LNGFDLLLAVGIGRVCPGQVLGWGGAGELVEVADEVGLVGVAGLACGLPPVQPLALVQATQDRFEADQAGGGLGPQPDLVRNRVIRCLWLQPTSPASWPMGTLPPPEPGAAFGGNLTLAWRPPRAIWRFTAASTVRLPASRKPRWPLVAMPPVAGRA
jgi:hypothetical protein